VKRVVIVGNGGSGKSTLAREMGGNLELEVIHLDVYFWQPGWIETPKAQWREIVARLVARDAWVMDGSYAGGDGSPASGRAGGARPPSNPVD